jgi:hypothetical protein
MPNQPMGINDNNVKADSPWTLARVPTTTETTPLLPQYHAPVPITMYSLPLMLRDVKEVPKLPVFVCATSSNSPILLQRSPRKQYTTLKNSSRGFPATIPSMFTSTMQRPRSLSVHLTTINQLQPKISKIILESEIFTTSLAHNPHPLLQPATESTILPFQLQCTPDSTPPHSTPSKKPHQLPPKWHQKNLPEIHEHGRGLYQLRA